MPTRELPLELVAALRRARGVELAAGGRAQRERAITATSRLMLASVEAGWRIYEVAAVLGIARSAAQMRIKTARDRGMTTEGLDVTPAPRRPRTRGERLAVPVEEREWLTATEAAEIAGVNKSTIPRWRRLGFLPNTQDADGPRPLYLRADVRRIIAAPRAANGGIDDKAAAAWLGARAGVA